MKRLRICRQRRKEEKENQTELGREQSSEIVRDKEFVDWVDLKKAIKTFKNMR